MRRSVALVVFLSLVLLASAGADAEGVLDGAMVPFIDGPWRQIAGNPDLGDDTSERQQPVDFGLWQAADETWQLWSCIRFTNCGGHTRVFHGWEGKRLTDGDWKPLGVVMKARPDLGEPLGGLQAPHVVKHDGVYRMLYGDWEHICLATSRDGKHFERVLNDAGRTARFTEGRGVNTRDAMSILVGDQWLTYYCAFAAGQGVVYCRKTDDLEHWSESRAVAFGGRAGVGPYAAECPHVVRHEGLYYLFRTQMYGENARTSVYASADPLDFGLNQDRLHYVGELAIAAPELVMGHEGQDYIAALRPGLDGVQIARLGWSKPPRVGAPVFDLSSEAERSRWRVVNGDIDGLFVERGAGGEWVVSTAGEGEPEDDDTIAVVESPPFVVDSRWYFVSLSGGADRERLTVELVEAETGKPVASVSPTVSGGELERQRIDLTHAAGKSLRVRLRDRATHGWWTHLNFGGLHRGVVEAP